MAGERIVKHHNNFDLIRLLAACQVLYSHSTEHLKLPINSTLHVLIMQFPGVAIFFAVSGFLVSRSWLKASSLTVYADHRARRIYPGLWLNLSVLFAACIITGSVVTTFPKLPLFILGTFIGGSDEVGQRVAGWIFKPHGFYEFFPSAVLWTLPIELGFYLLVPVIFSKRFKDTKAVLLSVGCWVTLSLLLLFAWHSQGPFSVFRFLWVFLVGASLNLLWDRLGWLFEGKAIFWLPAYCLLSLVLTYSGYSTYFASASISGIFATIVLGATIISVAYSFKPLAGILEDRDVSYGIYLWHMPIIWTMLKFGYIGSWVFAIAAYLLTVAVAAISWVCVERPTIRSKLSNQSNKRLLAVSAT